MAIGLDIGTSFLVCASKDPKNDNAQVEINSVRDAFLDIEDADASTINMLKMSNVSYIQDGNQIYVVGESALNLANLLKVEARRPLCQGVISAGELDAERMLVILLRSILKEPKVENENVFYSVPAKSIDREMDTLYHSMILKKIIESMGFRATSMNEAAAIVYANCSSEGFTAMCTSMGAGMCNTAVVYKTMVGAAWSVSRAGDWLDQSSAKAVGKTATQMMTIKEKGFNLMDPTEGDPRTLREREALIIYYKNLIHYVIDSIKREFKKDNSKIELPDQIPWIISGGTSLCKGFLEFFKNEFDKERATFPVGISSIRMAESPLNDVAKGLLIAAMNE